MNASFLVSIGVAATFPAMCAAQMPELRLDLRCAGSEQLLVSIRNTGKADTAVVVGSVLGNGANGLIVQPSDFISHTAPKRMNSLPSAVRLSVRLTVRTPAASNADMEGIRLWRVWKEKDSLASNELRIPDDCR